MEHLGDITKIRGCVIPPVDVAVGGSPYQDLSIAGNQAAVDAVNRMAEYIVTKGRVDYWLCDDIPEELHLKHQPQNDGNYANAPCIKCVAEYFMGGPQEAGEETV